MFSGAICPIGAVAPDKLSQRSTPDLTRVSQDDLSLKECVIPKAFNRWLKVKFEQESIVFCESAEGALSIPLQSRRISKYLLYRLILKDKEFEQTRPDNTFLTVEEDEELTVKLHRSKRLNEVIFYDTIREQLPVIELGDPSVFSAKSCELCLHVGMGQIASIDFSSPGTPNIFTTTQLDDCIFIVLWDKTHSSLVISHVMQSLNSEHYLDFMLRHAHQNGVSSEVIVAGGFTQRMGEQSSFFNLIEGYFKRRNISIRQTFLGEIKRPRNIAFNSLTGELYELRLLCRDKKRFGMSATIDDKIYQLPHPSGGKTTASFTAGKPEHYIPVSVTYL